jgi:hypothetical protein
VAQAVLHHVFDHHPAGLHQQVEEDDKADITEEPFDAELGLNQDRKPPQGGQNAKLRTTPGQMPEPARGLLAIFARRSPPPMN